MLRHLSEEDQAFRRKARDWLDAHFPKEKAWKYFGLVHDREWLRIMAVGGWLAPHWRKCDGGMGLSPVQRVIMIEEWARAGAPAIETQEMNHIGPLLLMLGTEAQKREHLPKMLQADCRWAQGYSEPNSGSDLASLRTRGVVQGHEVIVNGQKIWSTLAHDADWIYLLIRTGNGKRDISFILVDLTSNGISRRPIRDLTGAAELSEVFFDDVRVPVTNVVGEINDGWRVANALLAKERASAGTPSYALNALHRLRKAARMTETCRDPWIRERLVRAEVVVLRLEAAFLDALERERVGEGNAFDVSYLKVLASETTQCVARLIQDISGPNKTLVTPQHPVGEFVDFSKAYMAALPYSIFGGSDEIQRNLIATNILGLPRETTNVRAN